ISVSARAAFTKYSVQPASPIDFGAMIKGTKKSQVIILENKGMLSFKFFIHQAPSLQRERPRHGLLLAGDVQVTAVRHHPLLALFLQAQLSMGMFTVSPCSGSVSPWGQQMITVECNAGQEGKCEEQLCIIVSGR
ncbi:HYDIN protein, partial [Formicarius rufipectus]|nr:HYDIN protein [Formicarius rufipectus]